MSVGHCGGFSTFKIIQDFSEMTEGISQIPFIKTSKITIET